MEFLKAIWQALADSSPALQALAALAAIIALVIPIVRPPFRGEGNREGEGQREHIVPDGDAPLTPPPPPGDVPKAAPSEQRRPPGRPRSPENVLADLMRVGGQLAPPPLSQQVFPRGLDVLHFVPDERLSIRVPGSRGIFRSGGWFSIAHFLIVPGIFGNWIGGSVGMTLFTLLGFGTWAWLVWWRGTVVTIDLKRRTWSASGAIGFSTRLPPPQNLGIERDLKGTEWRTRIAFGTTSLWECRSSEPESGPAAASPFVVSLRATLGLPIEVAKGIFIYPGER